MSKTSLIKDIEVALYHYCYDLGHILVKEVTMPNKAGIVGTLSVELNKIVVRVTKIFGYFMK